MAGEGNREKWRGIRPVSPAENIPVEATDLDIRNITKVSDSIEVFQTTYANLRTRTSLQFVGTTGQTSRDWSLDFAKLDIALSALRDAITGASPNNNTLYDIVQALGDADEAFPSGTKMLFKQSSAPTGWTVDNTIQDNSMVVYRTSGNYDVDGGSQDPTSMVTPAQDLDEHASSRIDRATAVGYVGFYGGVLQAFSGSGTDELMLVDTVNTITLTPYYTHVIVATKD